MNQLDRLVQRVELLESEALSSVNGGFAELAISPQVDKLAFNIGCTLNQGCKGRGDKYGYDNDVLQTNPLTSWANALLHYSPKSEH